MPYRVGASLIFALLSAGWDSNAAPGPASEGAARVQAITPPLNPLPPEESSRGVTRFSFIVYGDTRGRRDGKDVQYEHSLAVDSVLATIKKLKSTAFPVRFVLQTGDAVVNGRDPRQWNTSFIGRHRLGQQFSTLSEQQNRTRPAGRLTFCIRAN